MAKQVYYPPARNGQSETAGTAQLPKGQCQEVSIVQLEKIDLYFQVVVLSTQLHDLTRHDDITT